MSSGRSKLSLRRRAQTPPVTYDSEEPSPEPTPAPPEPQPQEKGSSIQPPWTPYYSATEQFQNTSEDESLPSIPGAPSPYSPPPASLFSGEEFPPKTVRKPVQEVRIQSAGSRSRALHDVSLNHPRSISSKDAIDRSQLLPTVLYLKKDLEETNQSLFMLQQENKALSAECSRFQNEIEQWRAASQATSEKEEALQERCKLLEASNGELNQQVEEYRATIEYLKAEKDHAVLTASKANQDASKTSNELSSTKTAVARLETEKTKLQGVVESLQSEIRDVRTKSKEQSLAAAQKLKSVTEDCETKVRDLKNENKSHELEIDRLKAMLHEAHQCGNKEVELVSQLRVDLANAVSEVEELRDAKAILKSELGDKEASLQEEIDRLKDELAEALAKDEELAKAQAESEGEVKGFQAALADATEREDSLLLQKEALQRELTTKINEMQEDLDRLQQDLATANAEKQSLQASLEQKNKALKESYAKYGTLRSEKDTLQKEVTRARKSLASASKKPNDESPGSDSQNEIHRLQEALEETSAMCNQLRTERSALAKELAVAKHSRSDVHSAATNTTAQNRFVEDTGDNAVPDRLGRIRDATERALLVQEYRRDVARLKSEHEAEIKTLTARHDQDLKDVFEEAKSEVSARARETRRRLQNEYESKLAALERSHQAELSRVQRECDKNTAAAEGAVEAASAEAAAITEQLDKEMQTREALEGTVRELERKLVIERQKSKLSSQWMTNRKQWQQETNNLISNIQQECNTIFTQNMARTNNSPRSVATDDSLSVDEQSTKTTKTPAATWRNWKPTTSYKSPLDVSQALDKPTTSYKSPLDVSQALDETEALVNSLMMNE